MAVSGFENQVTGAVGRVSESIVSVASMRL